MQWFRNSAPASQHRNGERRNGRQRGKLQSRSQAEAVNDPEGLRAWIERTLYHTGALRWFMSLSRSWELRKQPEGRLPHLRRVRADKFAILCYHRVGTQGIPYHSSVEPELFDAQMRFVRENYRILSFTQMCQELESPESKGPAVVVTFDDGYRDLYTHAFPIFKKYQIPATVFLTVDAIETGEVAWYDRIFLALQVYPGDSIDIPLDGGRRYQLNSPSDRTRAATEIISLLRKMPDDLCRQFCRDLETRVTLPSAELQDRMLTWDQIREMQDAGIFFGSHTLRHPVVGGLSPEEALHELAESRNILEKRLGQPILDFAFPFGKPSDCGSAHILVARCGYRSAVTTSWGINTSTANRYALRRAQIGDDRSLSSFAFELNKLFFLVEDDETGSDASVEVRGTSNVSVDVSRSLGR